MKYDLEKNEKRIKSMTPSKIDAIMFIASIFGIALSVDLDLLTFGRACTFFFFYELTLATCWLIHCIVFAIIKNIKAKKDKEVKL